MKKLMFAAALALGATCFADSIESNVVGYQTYELKTGYNLITPIFENTDSAKKLDIQSMKLTGDIWGNGADEYIQIINKDGNFEETYVWWNADPSDPVNYPAGWALNGDEDGTLVTREIDMGEGFYLYSPKGGALQVAGAVSVNPLSKNFQVGYNLFGNATPHTIDIQNIVLSGDIWGNGADEYIQIINKDGNFEETYVWWNADPSDPINYPAGWALNGDEDGTLVTREIKPGEAFYMYTPKVGSGCKCEIKLPTTLK